MRKKIIKYSIIGLTIIFIAIQFIPVDRHNPPITGEITAPSEVKNILQRSCYDCHSNQTDWHFYSYIAPVSWLVTNDVNEGREELNFSEWNKYDSKKQNKKINEIYEEIAEGKMPMKIYLITHPSADLTKNEKQVIKDWTDKKDIAYK
ncbi:MAG: heme-binding domain-containing protein [Ignavibacteriae bacterium]|nr:heme-binding protein [Ignavibacteriota bacterium]NOG98489.1 heme-binding domain-containing protein [Ignavibacteriota bacterium]